MVLITKGWSDCASCSIRIWWNIISEKGDPTSSISDLAEPYYNHGLGVAVNRGGNIIAVGAPGHYTSMAGGMDFSYQQNLLFV